MCSKITHCTLNFWLYYHVICNPYLRMMPYFCIYISQGRWMACVGRVDRDSAELTTRPKHSSHLHHEPQHRPHTHTPPSLSPLMSVAPPGFCNRGEVRYGSIGGLEYEVPQSRLYCREDFSFRSSTEFRKKLQKTY